MKKGDLLDCKKGEILVENVIFILLNFIFLTIMIGFLVNQGSSEAVLEEVYAKELALVIDYSKPVMTIKFDMEKGKEIAEKNGIPFRDVVKIDNDNHMVRIKLGDGKGYSYSFFNNVDVTAYPDVAPDTSYVIKINGYNEDAV